VVEGPLTDGYASEGPFDAIFIGGAIGELPQALLAQLKDNGRLVAVEGTGNAAMAKVWYNDAGICSAVSAFNCAIPALPGFARKPAFEF
jgi:protein-L-isoaspartate(D-aspartate) O-methyltransferase